MLKLKFKLRTSGDMCSIIKMITTWDTHCCTYVFVHSVCFFYFSFSSVLYDENSHQLIHSRLRVWSALMLVGFMSNERFVHVWMNEWMNRMEIYVDVYTHSYIKARREEKSLSVQKSSLPHVVFRLCFTLNYGIICMMNFFPFSFAFDFVFEKNVKVQK